MIERTIAKRGMSLKDDFKILLATGSRQVGKTTLMKALREPERRYVTLDSEADRELARNDPEAFFPDESCPLHD